MADDNGPGNNLDILPPGVEAPSDSSMMQSNGMQGSDQTGGMAYTQYSDASTYNQAQFQQQPSSDGSSYNQYGADPNTFQQPQDTNTGTFAPGTGPNSSNPTVVHTQTQRQNRPLSSVKLFIGQVPRDMGEEPLRELFRAYGTIIELSILRDKTLNTSRGCAFLTYGTRAEAEAAIEALHAKHTFPQMKHAMQVQYAQGELDRIEAETKLFIAKVPPQIGDPELRPIFTAHGEVLDIFILRGKECAFVKYKEKESAHSAIEALNGKFMLPGTTNPLVVKFADVKPKAKPNQQQGQAAAPVVAANPYGGQPYYYQYMYPQQQASATPQGWGYPQTQQYMMATPQQGGQGALPVPQQQMASYQTGYYPGYGAAVPQYGAPTAQTQQYGQQVQAPGMGGMGQPPPPGVVQAGGTGAGQSEGPPGANLFIYHIPNYFKDPDLAGLFAPFGTVLSAKVFVDRNTGENKGFGFVSFDTPAAAEQAIASMNGALVAGKRLKVQHKKANAGKPY
mmetsp:Transcript_46595/g.76076  ORF Transcript_46595/g.76076 Transcript_46595/m.76076 type:complete len:506 (+) Transcript_46595:170-1687(+)